MEPGGHPYAPSFTSDSSSVCEHLLQDEAIHFHVNQNGFNISHGHSAQPLQRGACRCAHFEVEPHGEERRAAARLEPSELAAILRDAAQARGSSG
jgi:hypothetical protein